MQKDIENFLKNELCAQLGQFKDECVETVDTYGLIIAEFLASELDPETRCKGLGFCASSQKEDVASVLRKSMLVSHVAAAAVRHVASAAVNTATSSAECEMCKLIAGKIEEMLSNNATEAEIIAFLDKVCYILPATIKKECLDFIDTYGPGILTLLLQDVSPDVLCATLGLCPSKIRVVKAIQDLPNKPDPEECLLCKTVIQYLDSIATDKTSEDKIKADLEKVCNFLPEKVRASCDAFVEKYADEIIKAILEDMTPEKVCVKLGLCAGASTFLNAANVIQPVLIDVIKPVDTPKLGTKECSWGPSFWCASQKNAENARPCNTALRRTFT